MVETALHDIIEDGIANDDGDPDAVRIEIVPGGIAVLVKPTASKDLFVEFLKEWADGERHEFTSMTLDDLRSGQSYISLGGWLGSQSVAFMVLALGVHHGAWAIMSPYSIFGIDPETASAAEKKTIGDMIGSGFIYNSGFSDEFLALLF